MTHHSSHLITQTQNSVCVCVCVFISRTFLVFRRFTSSLFWCCRFWLSSSSSFGGDCCFYFRIYILYDDLLAWLPECHLISLSKGLAIFLHGMKGAMQAPQSDIWWYINVSHFSISNNTIFPILIMITNTIYYMLLWLLLLFLFSISVYLTWSEAIKSHIGINLM